MENFPIPKSKPTFHKDMDVNVKLDMQLRAEVHFDFSVITSHINGLLSTHDHNKAVLARELVDKFIEAVESLDDK